LIVPASIFVRFFCGFGLTGRRGEWSLGFGGREGAFSLLADERLVDVGDDTTASNGSLDQGVQLLVSSDGQLQMSGGDPLDFEIL